MIDLATEKLLTLEQAAEKLLVSKATLYRWITNGSKGVRLEAIKMGVHWRTSEEALQRFGDRLTPNQEPTPPVASPICTPNQRRRDLKWVEEELDKFLGVRKCEACRKVIEAANVVIPKNERLWCPDCFVKRRSATLGQRIRMFRWSASLSQQMLSDRTGIGVDKIRAYELAEAKPTESHIAKLVEVFGPKLMSGLEKKPKDATKGSATETVEEERLA